VLNERRDKLDELSARLLDQEVIEGEALRELLGPMPDRNPDGTVPVDIPPPA
jgi:hypothetical protein